MFCTKCGNRIPDNAQVCPYCQQRSSGINYGGRENPGVQGGFARARAKVDNIFSALMYEKSRSSQWEFGLWCTVCLMVVLSFLAIILVDGDDYLTSSFSDSVQTLWIFVMILGAGVGTAMAFRGIKPIMLYASQIVFQFILLIAYYNVMSGWVDQYISTVPGMVVAVFVCLILLALGIIACSSVQFFSNFELGKVLSILEIVYAGLLVLMPVLMYFLPHSDALEKAMYKAHGWEGSCYWLGTSAYVIIGVVIALYSILFFNGMIESKKRKIYAAAGAKVSMPSIRCIQGSYPGQQFYLSNAEFSVGSQQGVNLVLPDPYVSQLHCTIRYNMQTRTYEIRDLSSNGTYLSNGYRLQKGMYTPLPKGTVFFLGSTNQQFRLM